MSFAQVADSRWMRAASCPLFSSDTCVPTLASMRWRASGAWLRGAQAGYITGQNLLLDGGNYSGVP